MITAIDQNHVRTATPPRSNRDWALTALLEGWTEEQVHQRLRRRLHGKAMQRVWDFFFAFHAVYQRCCELEEEDSCFKRHPRPLPYQTAKAQSKEDKKAGRKRPTSRKTRVVSIQKWARTVKLQIAGRWVDISDINALPPLLCQVVGMRWRKHIRKKKNRTDVQLNKWWSERLHAEQKKLTKGLTA